jgi:cold shock CspA family protein
MFSQSVAPHTLATPKPTTFQHYFVQDRSANHDPDIKVALANFTTSPRETQIRGHKRYWHWDGATGFDIEASAKERDHEKQLTRIRPLNAGVRFTFRIRFENLRPEELGALWWALALPGEAGETHRHKLGMGKSLGMGSVAITPHLYLTKREQRYSHLFGGDTWDEATSAAEAQPYLAAFEKYTLTALGLEKEIARLSQVERIRMLLAMLRWPGPDRSLTRYMQIEHPELDNEFKERPVLPDPLAVRQQSQALKPAPVAPEAPTRVEVEAPAGYQLGKVRAYGLGPIKDFGFIQPREGSQLIFVHKNHLAPNTGELAADDSVRFRVIEGLKGLEARDVEVIE